MSEFSKELMASEQLPNTGDPLLVRDFDLGSTPKKLKQMRLVDYSMVFVVGPIFISYLLQFIILSRAPGLNEIEIILILGLCFLVGLRNFGVIESSNWIDYAIVLPLGFVVLSFIVFAAFLTQRFSSDLFERLFNLTMVAGAALLGSVTALQLISAKFLPGGARLASWLRQLNARGGAPRNELKTPVIDRRRGLLLGTGGLLILASLIILQSLFPTARNGLFSVYMFVNFAAFGMLLRSRRYLQISADALLDSDRRNPILLLRSFEDDQKVEFAAQEQQLFDFSLETRLANHFMRFGPFIAVGSPLDAVPQIGAARTKLADDQWQGVVLGWMAAASVIVMLGGKTKWVGWELGRLIENQYLNKFILLLPSMGISSEAPARGQPRAIRKHQKRLADTEWAGALATVKVPQTVRVITFGPNGSLSVIRSKSHARDAYHLAALLAHDLMLPTALPQPSAALRRARSWSRRLIVAGTALGLLATVVLFVPGPASNLCNMNDAFCVLSGQSAEIKRATQAADQFLILASKSSKPPSISDPAFRTLLTKIFDTTMLNNYSTSEHVSFVEIAIWLDRIEATYSVYLLSGTGLPDIGTAIEKTRSDPTLEKHLADNVSAWHEEIGLGLDSEMRVLGKFLAAARSDFARNNFDVDSEATTQDERVRKSLEIFRHVALVNLIIDIWAICDVPCR